MTPCSSAESIFCSLVKIDNMISYRIGMGNYYFSNYHQIAIRKSGIIEVNAVAIAEWVRVLRQRYVLSPSYRSRVLFNYIYLYCGTAGLSDTIFYV